MDKLKLSPWSVPSRRPPVSSLLSVFGRAFLLKEPDKSDWIRISFCGWLQFPPGQSQGASLSCLLGLGCRTWTGVSEELGTEEAEENLRLSNVP